jgi:nitroreductase
MDLIRTILTRRSVRNFKQKAIPNELTKELIRAGMYAPSARNTQPWHFIVTDKREKLDALSEIHPYALMLKKATLAILVCGDLKLENSEYYIIQNCSAATQNILLAAHSLGLGSVWLGIQPRKERIKSMKDFFKLPDHIIPVSLIAVGYPDESVQMPERFKPERIKYDEWKD